MPTSLLSPFERLLLHKNQPRSVYVRLYHPTFSPAFPATQLLSLLRLPSQLSLRRVSPTTKTWVDSADPSVFSKLNLLFPFNTFSAGELLTLHNNSPQCESLTITVSAGASISNPSDTTPFPPFPGLKHLHLIAPTHDPFQPLLAFRLALQCAHVPLLTHLTITNLSFPGILALRWGTFTSFGDAGWTGSNVWHGITYLDVKLRGWWEEDEPQERNEHKHYEVVTEIGTDIETETETEKTHRRKEDWRTCTRLLHDWLHSFAANTNLQTLKFSWAPTATPQSGDGGPNPFLLDETVSRDGNTKLWFSAPRIQWPTSLIEVWLGNVVVSLNDVRMMKERMGGLERVGVMPEFLDKCLGGRKVTADDGRVWAELDMQGQGVGEWVDVVRREVFQSPAAAAATRGDHCEGGDRDRASMDLPFVLELSPEDGTLL